MAQKLKDETRRAIIEAAKKEFLEKGFEDASMRSIAAKANITVGNIYRYFENKEELNKYIVAETCDDISDLLNSLKVERLSKEPRVFEMKSDPIQLKNMVDELSVRLCKLYEAKGVSFNILLKDEASSAKLKEWFKDTIRDLIGQSYSLSDRKKQIDLLSDAYACAIYEGLCHLFANNELDTIVLLKLVRNYLNSFFRMVLDDNSLR
ncbi:MAG: TetR/AcrR family transcriptional regulator [Erysipelotrichaceae bacterium]|nr:TetR/AcrR family transcriptional regulator [Erysipelotrichaceae bacterium]